MDKYEQILNDCKSRMNSSLNNFSDNLKKIRTGRANPSMLEGITIDYYGTETPLNQCCSITVEDSKTLSLTPWDKSLVQEIDKSIQKSDRGEYEITDVNKEYLRQNKLDVKVLGRGAVWLDTGTFSSLMQANQYVQLIEERQGRKIGCIEEAAYKMGFIDKNKLLEIAEPLQKSGYGEYLINLLDRK